MIMMLLLAATAYASPLTGDNGIGTWIVLMVVAVIVLIGVMILMKKKSYIKLLMKNMKVLVDTNIIIDFLTKREPYYENSRKVLQECVKENNKGYVIVFSESQKRQ